MGRKVKSNKSSSKFWQQCEYRPLKLKITELKIVVYICGMHTYSHNSFVWYILISIGEIADLKLRAINDEKFGLVYVSLGLPSFLVWAALKRRGTTKFIIVFFSSFHSHSGACRAGYGFIYGSFSSLLRTRIHAHFQSDCLDTFFSPSLNFQNKIPLIFNRFHDVYVCARCLSGYNSLKPDKYFMWIEIAKLFSAHIILSITAYMQNNPFRLCTRAAFTTRFDSV